MYKMYCFYIYLLILCSNAFIKIYGNKLKGNRNTFSEELLIRPLPSGHIYSHFEFTTLWGNKAIDDAILNFKDFEFVHYDLFPRAFGEIVERYQVRELHLSLTQGLWRYQKWGYPVSEAPPGAQLWAWFNPNIKDIDQTWKDLVNALSGLFCASLNFIDSTNTVSPELSFRPMGVSNEMYEKNSSYLRYTALPRENVCTENLTPWKKLLPCDTKSGLATLLHPTPLYSAHYHSLALHLRPVCKDSECQEVSLELVQSLSLVQSLLHKMEGRQDWTLRRLFSSPLISVCPLAETSKVYVDVTDNENFDKFRLHPQPTLVESDGQGASRRSFAVYDALEMVSDDPFNLQARYPGKHIYGVIPPPGLQVSRFITGHGLERGSITVKLTNTCSSNLTVVYLEVLPWYLRLFFHPSHSLLPRDSNYVRKLRTARDRERGWLYEAVVTVAAESSTEMRLEFSRALLKWLEYPPDANHGFYVPSAIFSVRLPTPVNVSSLNNDFRVTGLRQRLKMKEEKEEGGAGGSPVRIVSETLLVSLPTPDFSMPYNVICLACTVVALAFGPIHNITTKSLTMRKLEKKTFPGAKLWEKIKNRLKRRGEKNKEEEENEERVEPSPAHGNQSNEEEEEEENEERVEPSPDHGNQSNEEEEEEEKEEEKESEERADQSRTHGREICSEVRSRKNRSDFR